MTNEQLLQPRYEVIAGYPDSEFKIGEILDRDWFKYENDDEETGKIIWKISDFPHLFRKLKWWEKRKPEEMPEYVKWDYNPKVDNENVKGLVEKVVKWVQDGHGVVVSGSMTIATCHWMPATETEYLNYLNVKQ